MGYVDVELVKLFGTKTTLDALRKVIPELTDAFELKEALPWTRAGGESYILPFEVTDHGQYFSGIFKASTTMTPELSVKNAIYRRNLLKAHGVNTPQFHGHGKGIVLEEFLPHDINEAHVKFGLNILEDIAHAYGVISALGFRPVINGLLRDFRADKNGNMHLIDFGVDLGEPGNQICDLWDMFANETSKALGISLAETNKFKSFYNLGFLSTKKALTSDANPTKYLS